MDAAASFSADYSEARDKFVAAAQTAGARLERITNPNRGPRGEALSTDVAWVGPSDAEAVLVMISGTHGVEGFCGSGAQVDWLARGEAQRLPGGVAVLLVHAVNPYGFAWLRRVTEENVDLNRNWIDFDAPPLPANPGYEALREAFGPAEWTEESRAATAKVIGAYLAEHGQKALAAAASSGQYGDPKGIYYGGAGPTWARRTQTAIYETYLGQASRIGVIDYHTGLGPWGFAEQIILESAGHPRYERAARWYGSALASVSDGNSASAELSGDGLAAAPELLSHADVTGIAMEYGTVSPARVLYALRADNWLHAHGDPTGPDAAAIKAQIRDAFYGDRPDWKGMVAGQSLLVTRQALAGLAAGL
ncbi:MAG: M14 family metallopeptidase [Phenylobacterium sp.]|uniref:M14 family metallopeptidase n=1 Tax=Phenylobacterium sp. TaxID=1871053 RepID=UPI00391BAC37